MSSVPLRHAGALGAVAATLALGALVVPRVAGAAPSSDALIAEVYGGGGNSGATLTQDFVELADRGSQPVSVDGWSVQYLSASPGPTSKWQVTRLTGSIPAGGRYLVAEAKGSGGTVALPTPDATGSISMSATAGTVALVTGSDALTCLTAADCAADSRVRDLVGFGGAVVREGTSAPAPSNTTSVNRGAGLADTDDNGTDFATAAPTPANSGGGSGDPSPTPTPTPTDTPTPGSVRIHDIQGTTRISPDNGKPVTNVPGIVTGVRATGSSRGFWFQDPQPDDDPRTSEGLFVFTGSGTPAVKPGDSVLVSGTISEYYPGGASSGNQSVTELSKPKWTVLSSGNPLPAAFALGPDTVPAAYTPDAGGGSIEPLALQPSTYALDLFESLEGMRVRVDDAPVIAPSNAYDELWVTTRPADHRSAHGGVLYSSYDDPNSGRLEVTSLLPDAEHPFPQANVGDALTGTTEGPLDYVGYGGYELQATTLGALHDGGLTPEVTRRQENKELAVATYNVENLAPSDAQSKFDRLAKGVVHNLATPDVVALEEIQDNSGAVDDGTVAADVTLGKFVDAIVAAGGPRYQWREIDPVNDADGGQPGGNIRVAFLFNPDRVSFIDRPGGDSTTAVQVVGDHGQAGLSVSPGRVDPGNAAWTDSRKPLAGMFEFHGHRVIVVADHFNSKGGDQSLHSRFQPPTRSSEVQRRQQAAVVHGFVEDLLKTDRKANVVVVGDFNDYQFSPALQTLTAGGVLEDLIGDLPLPERYSYVYDGNSQVLDHILTSPRVSGGADYDVVHINAEFAGQTSDHDPQVVRLRPKG
ncbi:endonuclease/exonuclease/phosphatase family protein [Actinoallomurus rhizosphaericola]|uniref:endonuclease/exonuclease/phosphatase family protein n=1 Tax=Actinoallomurus rhizosphaericola TaxID=2952536 RepID=UPI0020922543|nr:endonuclease/exonuclease/phosphatase family protein [Actinoallomurus rhizosphaericola]MCO5997850.1 lamin tail domain-containing protein [Actinoallomurus rhizosphaericola]